MISRRLPTTLAAVLLTAGCGSGTTHHPAKTPSPSPARKAPGAQQPAAASATSRYVDVSRSAGVKVVRLPRRLGANETRLVNLTPDSFGVGRPKTATLGEIDVGTGIPPAGVTVHVVNADYACGTPFLATPGHGYRVSCTITARRRGTVRVTLTEHNPRTGAAGSSMTGHAPAR